MATMPPGSGRPSPPPHDAARAAADPAARAPAWLRDVVALIESEAGNIAPLKDDRGDIPEYIYRH